MKPLGSNRSLNYSDPISNDIHEARWQVAVQDCEQFDPSVHNVHRDCRRDGVARVSSRWEEPHAYEHPDPGLPAVFNGRGESPGVTPAGVEIDGRPLRVGSDDTGVGVVAIR